MLVTLVVVIMGLLLWLLCIETVVVIEVRTSDKRVTNVLIAFLD
jgi:predicted metal-binding membrane protein